MTSELEPYLAEEVARVFETSPFILDLGLELVQARQGTCETVLHLKPKHYQQDGFIHAGVQATMADHTAGTAATTMAKPGQFVLTAELRISLLRPAKGDLLRCKSTVLKPGSRLTFVESEVFCETGASSKMVSKASVIIALVDK